MNRLIDDLPALRKLAQSWIDDASRMDSRQCGLVLRTIVDELQKPVEAIDELERLEKAATPGPWRHGHNPDGYDPIDYFKETYKHGEPGRVYLTCIPVPGKDVNDEALFTAITGNGPTSEANARLIAALRNAAPELIRMTRAIASAEAAEKGGE